MEVLTRRMAGLALSRSSPSLCGVSIHHYVVTTRSGLSTVLHHQSSRTLMVGTATASRHLNRGDHRHDVTLCLGQVPVTNNSSAASLSTNAISQTGSSDNNTNNAASFPPGFVSDTLSGKDGKKYALLDMSHKGKKLKPHIVKRRLKNMRTYIGREQDIRGSPWKMNLVCQLVAGLPYLDALEQLAYCEKAKAPLLAGLLQRTAKKADMNDSLQPSQLEVAECFATHGTHLKRMKPMARGRSGIMHHRYCHVRLVLREIDFTLRIIQAPNLNQKRKWVQRRARAEQEGAKALADRAEIEELERAVKEQEEAKKKK